MGQFGKVVTKDSLNKSIIATQSLVDWDVVETLNEAAEFFGRGVRG